MHQQVNIFWFRRDLRLEDNAGLFVALNAGLPVLPVFIFDTDILDALEDKDDRRVNFIHAVLDYMQEQLKIHGATLDVRYGKPLSIFKKLTAEYAIHTVFTNHDYEPYASARDAAVEKMLQGKGIGFRTFKDQVIFEKDEVMKPNGEPYALFTPYARKWRSQLQPEHYRPYNTVPLFDRFLKHAPKRLPSLASMGFQVNNDFPKRASLDHAIVKHYHKTRNLPGIEGTSRIGMHLRFGTCSIRQVVAQAVKLNDVFLNELIWREFFMQMLWHRPNLVSESCKPQYDRIRWRNNEKEFERWCAGKTGYPIVDAGMRQLNETGFMHNRVRMITASFLVKHLLVDWRWGEAYFGRRLADYELSSNNGNWQWVAGCGCDAAPYFRIFNPDAQTKKFDPKLAYIDQWVPERNSTDYPSPIVDHEMARERCLKVYKAAVARKG